MILDEDFILMLQGGSLGSFSTDICRLLQLCEEEDDATSALAAPKPEPDAQKVSGNAVFQEVCKWLLFVFVHFFVHQISFAGENLCAVMQGMEFYCY